MDQSDRRLAELHARIDALERREAERLTDLDWLRLLHSILGQVLPSHEPPGETRAPGASTTGCLFPPE